MECNKDEAIRAKSIAESKLEQNDIGGAIKFALRAQTLYPGLDGISTMLTTLDVHVSAENKINGQVDWYGVLRVDPTADEETIKRRYRKLALILHPDKNKSAGADGAFKLISEAKSLLLDKDKRIAYDLITGREEGLQHTGPSAHTGPGAGPWSRPDDPSVYTNPPVHSSNLRSWPGGQSTCTSSSWAGLSAWAHSGDPSVYTGGASAPSAESPFFTFAHWMKRNPRLKKKSVKSGPCGRARAPQRAGTFWTACHHCTMQFEYLKIYCNTILLCPNCHKMFMSLEMPRPIGRSRSHTPKPWPPNQHNSGYCNNLRTPAAKGRGEKAPDAREQGTWETGPNSFSHVTYQRGPLFKEPSVVANASYYAKSNASDGMEGIFKKRKFDNYRGLYGNNYNVPQGDDKFGNANAFGSGAYGFMSRCNV